MAKSKNSSTHHLGRKNHRNGILRLKEERYSSLKGSNLRYVRNRRRAIKFDPTIKKTKNYSKKIDRQRALKKQ